MAQSVEPNGRSGPYGKQFSPDQVQVSKQGLDLKVSPITPGDRYVKAAQLQSRAENVLFGTFRAVMKLPSPIGPTKGTCAALFYFLSDTKEIDLEFLSSFGNEPKSSYGTQTGREDQLTNPLAWKQVDYAQEQYTSFMEYRFDWSPSQVDYFLNGIPQHSTRLGVPQEPGMIILNHWSTGNRGWESGPPQSEAVLQIQSFKAFYNSSYDANTCAQHPKPVCSF